MSNINKRVDHIIDLYIKKKYSEVISQGNELLPKIKNRDARRDIYEAIGSSYLYLNEFDFAIENLKKSRSHLGIKEFYTPIYKHFLNNDKYEYAIKCLKEILKVHPDDTEVIMDMYRASLKLNNDLHGLMYLTNTKKWSELADLCRKTIFWNLLDDLDALFMEEFYQGNYESNISTLFSSFNIDKMSLEDLYNLNKNTINMILEKNKYLNIIPMVEGFGHKTAHKRKAKLKIGYISSDFKNHATMYLLLRVLELHNTDDFDIHFFITNKKQEDKCSERLEKINATKHYLKKESDVVIANIIKDQEIDILVDLKGYTGDTSTFISAYRPAPIIVNWLGYPGTLGVEKFADYIITDKIITPESFAPYFSETFAYMPHCYQPNDDSRNFSTTLTRSDVGLPENAVVFCSFNGLHKLNPLEFTYWCKLLKDVPNSVLWLLMPESNLIKQNLLKEAKKRGIEESQIIFAENLDNREHLERLSLADIGLDSFPCTSHTTASDLMLAGVPLIAQLGHTFCSRVSSSVVAANNCSELITHNIEEAYRLAYTLATTKKLLQQVKKEVKANLQTAPLYNSELFTKNLEKLYNKMWKQYENGKKEIITLD